MIRRVRQAAQIATRVWGALFAKPSLESSVASLLAQWREEAEAVGGVGAPVGRGGVDCIEQLEQQRKIYSAVITQLRHQNRELQRELEATRRLTDQVSMSYHLARAMLREHHRRIGGAV